MESSPSPQPFRPIPSLAIPQVLSVPAFVDSHKPELIEAFRRTAPFPLRLVGLPAVLAPLFARIAIEILLRVVAPYAIPILKNILAAIGHILAPEWMKLFADLQALLQNTSSLHPVTTSVLKDMDPDLLDPVQLDDPSMSIYMISPPKPKKD
jgi:hypothetical protein